MLQQDGSVKLVDLGIAKAEGIKDSLRTTTESVFGTPAYVSPEQALSSSDVDVRADIYSLGVVFFEMVSGRCPYTGKSAPAVLMQVMSDDPVPDVRDFAGDVPFSVAALIRRMCVKERNRRIGSMTALISELVKLGYVSADQNAEPEYPMDSAGSDGDDTALGINLDSLPQDSDNTLSFETKDVEIQRFVDRLKKRRLRRRIFLSALLLVTIGLITLIVIW